MEWKTDKQDNTSLVVTISPTNEWEDIIMRVESLGKEEKHASLGTEAKYNENITNRLFEMLFDYPVMKERLSRLENERGKWGDWVRSIVSAVVIWGIIELLKNLRLN